MGDFERKNVRDREEHKFREVLDDPRLSKVAVVVEQDPSNPIPVDPLERGEITPIWGEQFSVGGLSIQTVINYTIPVGKNFKIKSVHFSGDNRSVFYVEVNSSTILKHRLYFSHFSGSASFENVNLDQNDNIKIIVENKTNSLADFNATLIGNLYDI